MQSSIKLSKDTRNKYHIECYKNNSLNLRFTIKDEDSALIDLTDTTTVFSIYKNLTDLDAGVDSAELSVDCVNVADQSTTGKGLTDLTIGSDDMDSLDRRTYIFEIRTVFNDDDNDKSIEGGLLVL